MSNINIIAFSDFRGGAAKATLQQVRSILDEETFSIKFLVTEKHLSESLSIGPNKLDSICHIIKRVLSLAISKLQITTNKTKHSLNLFSSSHVLKKIDLNADIIHFHWLNNDTLSIKDLEGVLKSTKAKVIITLHDEWFFSGSEHYIKFDSTRFLSGYTINNKDVYGLDLDRWTFQRKLKLKTLLERNNVIFTVPSEYLLQRAKNSFLLSNTKIIKIGNIINDKDFKPIDKKLSRKILGLPENSFIIAYGAIGGGKGNTLKGYDLLKDALDKLKSFNYEINKKILLLTFGGRKNNKSTLSGFDMLNLGHIDSKEKLSTIYSCADITITPSRVESFGQVAAESLLCATPVIAFDNSGLTDIIQHNKSGLLVNAFDTTKLANAILKMLIMPDRDRVMMGETGRNFVLKNFTPDVLSNYWKLLYNID
ncbi:glycosyltransferase [Photorhabdus bodei]|uniref:glycosyltransferase n=1 Tax=Photorhabdus bodei TaxID=2029681 RepID=UPI0032B76878